MKARLIGFGVTLLLLLSSATTYAQSNAQIKALQDSLGVYGPMLKALKAEYVRMVALKEAIEANRHRVDPLAPEEIIKNRKLDDICLWWGVVIKDRLPQDVLQVYERAHEARQSLEIPYNEENNKQYLRWAKQLPSQVYPVHQDEAKNMEKNLRSYGYAMFCLADAITSVREGRTPDRSEVDPIPYTRNVFEEYIQWKRDDGIGIFPRATELRSSSPKAFPDSFQF